MIAVMIYAQNYGEIVELVDDTDTQYIFTNDKHKRGKLIVPKNSVDDYVEWECGEDGTM